MPLNNLGTATGSIKINTSDLKNADIALRSAGRGMIYMGAAAVAGFAAVVNEAAKFEKEMDFVQAITVASGDQMDALKAKAIDLGKSSVFGPVELAQAFTDLAKAGASVQDIIDGVGQASVDLAQAADVPIPFAGENLINILNTFKLGAEDATHVADLLAGAANASSVELEDIVTTMRYAGPVAQALGISIGDVNDAITVLGRVGIKGSIAGTSLRFAMTHLIPSTAKAQDAITSLGLHINETTGAVDEFTDTDGSLKDLASIFQILQERTKDLTDQQKVAVVNDIFGVRAMPSVLELMNAGAAGFAELNAEINKTTAADVASKRLDNLSGSIAKLKATIKTVMTEAGGPFQETVKGWVDGLRDLILAFDDLPDGVQKFLLSGLLAFGVLSILSGGFLLTVGNMVRTIRVMGELANAFSVIGRGIGALVVSIGELTVAILTSPIFWIAVLIIAIAAAVYLLWTRSEKFRSFVKGFWEDIKGWADAIGGFFEKAWAAVSNFFANWDQWWGKIKEGASAAWDAIKGFFTDIGKAIGSNVGGFFESLGSTMANAFNSAKDAVGGFIDSVGSFFGNLASTMGGAAKSAVDSVTGWFQRLSWSRIGYAIGFAVGRYLRLMLYDIPKKTAEGLLKVLGFFQDIFGQVVSFIDNLDLPQRFIQLMTTIVSTVWGWLSQIPGLFYQVWTSVSDWLLNFAVQLTAQAIRMGSDFVTGFINFILQLPSQFINLMTQALNWLLGAIPQFVNGAIEIGQGIFNGVIDFITDLPGRIYGVFVSAVNLVKTTVTSAYNAAKSFGSGLWNGFKDGIGIHSPSYVEQAMMSIDDQAVSTLRNLKNTVSSLNGTSVSLTAPSNLSSPMTAAAAQNGTWNQNAPLVGTAVIRRDSDITTLARQLDKERRQKARGRGVKLAPDFGAMGVS